MNIKILFFGFAACLMAIQPGIAADDDTPLMTQMEALSDAYKAIRREEDPVKGSALAREAQIAAIKAITETPELLNGMPEGPGKAKALAEYRMMMGNLISDLAKVELAFLDKDLDKVKEILLSLRDLKKQGHDKFMEDE